MNGIEIVLCVVSLAALIGAVVPWIFVALQKRGIDVQGALAKAQSGLALADQVADGISDLSPALPGIAAVDKVIEWAQKAVDNSEQLLKSQQIPEGDRKAKAVEMVKSCLASAGIAVTPDLEKIIDGAIEAAVLALPETNAASAQKSPADAPNF